MPSPPMSNGRGIVPYTQVDMIVMNQMDRMFKELTNNLVASRRDMYRQINDPRVDLNKECGYPETSELTEEHYRNQYDRNPIAARVVQCMPAEAWISPPTIYEDEDTKTETDFEITWDSLAKMLRGPSWYKEEHGSPIFKELLKLNILSRIGHFGVMVIGLNDKRDLREPVKGFENGFPETPTNAADKILFLQSFDETLVDITEYDQNSDSPRFGQPTRYNVTVNDPRQQHSGIGLPLGTYDVHWSRVIHTCDNYGQPGCSVIFAPPALRPVYNRCLDVDKLFGGGTMGTWRGAFPGISLETHPQLGGDIGFDVEAVKTVMERYMNSLQRYIAIEGASAKSLTPQVNDPSAQIDGQITAICIHISTPKRVFMGSERGELASGQDKQTWGERKYGYQCTHITPEIIIPFVNRCIMYGVVAEPKDGYCVDWPDPNALDPMEKAELATKRTEAMAKYVGGGLDVLMDPMDFLTRELGFEEDDARVILENVIKHIEKANPLAEQEAVPGRNPPPAPGMDAAGNPLPDPNAPPQDGPPKPGQKVPKAGPKAKPVDNIEINDGCGAGASGSPGFQPGNTCGKGDPMPTTEFFNAESSPGMSKLWDELQAAETPTQVTKIIKRYEKDDVDTLPKDHPNRISSGAMLFLKKERVAKLKSLDTGKQMTSEEARADRILRIRDSSGRGRARPTGNKSPKSGVKSRSGRKLKAKGDRGQAGAVSNATGRKGKAKTGKRRG